MLVFAKAQTVSTLVPFNVGDDLHYGIDGYIYSSHYGEGFFRKIDPESGSVDTILAITDATIGAIEVDDSLKIFTSSYDNGWIGYFREGDTTITHLVEGFSGPAGITHGSDGILYVANNQNARIIRIQPNGQFDIFTLGNPLFWPTGITIDPDNNLYVASLFNGQIIKITPNRQMSVLGNLPAILDNNEDVAYLTWASGKLYICHFGRHTIYEMDAETGDFHILAGTGQPGNADGPALEATFERPTGIAASPTGDTLYVTDGVAPNQRLRRIVLQGPNAAVAPTPALNVLKLRANPVGDHLVAEITLNAFSSPIYSIVDVGGKIWTKQPLLDLPAGKHILELPLSQLPTGSYFLHLNSELGNWVEKFVKT
ncbi:MAG: hypothetical protein DHS20C18_31850 [Saprospiraceae bacterium]|nr:MAG: hypothetical protein DHS20C18_31850 [Saprospiraceae bacterium]